MDTVFVNGAGLQGPVVRIPPPGPRSRALLNRQATTESSARSYPRRLPIAIRRGEGSLVEDEDGNVFIDFLTGAGAIALGHSHPELVETVQRQAMQLTQALDFPTRVKDEFISALLGILPAELSETTRILCCGPTGVNAVEAAIKLCKKATGRSEIIAFHGGFHGMSHGGMALSADPRPRAGIANTMPGVHFFPFSYCYRCPIGLSPDTCETNCVRYLEQTLSDTHSGMTKPAAVLLELIQGEGGAIPATVDFVRRVRKLTSDLDIPLIVDEIQTGCGRTGQWFAFEHYAIRPDVVILSKMLSGIGMPIAVVLYDERLDQLEPGGHTGTFRGNQLAFAAATTLIKVMERDGVLDNVRERGRQAREHLERVCSDRAEFVADVRSTGLMIGVELARRSNHAPWPEVAAAVQAEALRRGLILEIGGRSGSVVRMLPPLNVSRDTMATALAIFDAALNAAVRTTVDPHGLAV
ncbi:aspartate aminotransferase family protein [Nocardia anaemiae]|uniref:aspartate aminotransferase family protein n=1 Tax=Nocardia anaemiae TaxID=263910 RepID=UPI000B0F1175|nr:diaminobutyrate--2-oxoglutarate transaminase family protein [Nocardia anaemiae]